MSSLDSSANASIESKPRAIIAFAVGSLSFFASAHVSTFSASDIVVLDPELSMVFMQNKLSYFAKLSCIKSSTQCPMLRRPGGSNILKCKDLPPKGKGPFTSCEVDVEAVENCKALTCMTDLQMTCDLSRSLMTRCQITNPEFTYWSSDYTAACRKPSCEKSMNKVFKNKATACPATCDNPDAPSLCVLPDLNGCECERGFYLVGEDVETGQCVPENKCPGIREEVIQNAPTTEPRPVIVEETTPEVIQEAPTTVSAPEIIPFPIIKGRAVDGVWEEWGEWSQCTTTCGGGRQERSRVCKPPKNGGAPCDGESTDAQDCNNQPCPVDGIWGPYGQWSECSLSCGEGQKTRTRTCTPPTNGGKNCDGESTDTAPCNSQQCPGQCTDNSQCHADAFCNNGKCECKENFEGNGIDSCRKTCSEDECARFASCSSGKCKCKSGYVGIGTKKCRLTCGRKKCHAEALCRRKRCVCNKEFQYGDGVRTCSDTCGGKKCVKNAYCRRNKCRCKRRHYGIFEKGELIECRKFCRRQRCDKDATCVGRGRWQRCQCNQGFIGNGRQCHETCTCAAFGDPNILTFNKQLYNFNGECKYTMAKFSARNRCQFEVEVNYDKEDKKSADATMINYVVLKMYGVEIQLGPGFQAKVDNERMDLPYEKRRKFSIKKVGFNIIVETYKCYVSLRWNHEARIAILSMQKPFGNKVEGLCGKCNGNEDEWLVKGGGDVAKDEDKFRKIGASFAVVEEGNTCKVSKAGGCRPVRRKYRAMCRYLKLNKYKKCKAAHPKLFELLEKACYNDYCANKNDQIGLNKAGCRSEQSVVTLCHHYGYGGIRWRTRKCRAKCDRKTSRYWARTHACANNCVDQRAAGRCKYAKTEDCTCKRGYILSGDKCVRRGGRKLPNCGCKQRGRYIKLGSSYTSSDCRRRYTCKGRKGKSAALKLTESNIVCHREGYCGFNEKGRSCVCLKPYLGDGIEQCYSPDNCVFKENVENCINTVQMKGKCQYRSKHNNQCRYRVTLGENDEGEEVAMVSFDKKNNKVLKKMVAEGESMEDCAKVSKDSDGFVTIVEKICECPEDHPLNQP